MPLLQKPPEAAPTPPPADIKDASPLLAQLAALVSPAPTRVAPRLVRSSTRTMDERYNRVTRLLAMVVGVVACVGAWAIGAYFTLAWLAALGCDWAGAALVPFNWLGPAVGAATVPGAISIQHKLVDLVLPWLLPVAITVAEVGFDPGRTSGRVSRLLWAGFLLADATTTALGLYPTLTRSLGAGLVTLVLAAGGGVFLALVPEKVARRLIRENL